MTKLFLTLVLFCLVHNSISQAATCADGLYARTSPSFSDKGQCGVCSPICKTCTTSASNCVTYIDKVKGLSNGIPICNLAGKYNSAKDICDNCLEGCSACLIDYNICSSCKAGWDYDRKNGQCLRATLGLAAVVLALSVLMLLTGVISCICACKL